MLYLFSRLLVLALGKLENSCRPHKCSGNMHREMCKHKQTYTILWFYKAYRHSSIHFSSFFTWGRETLWEMMRVRDLLEMITNVVKKPRIHLLARGSKIQRCYINVDIEIIATIQTNVQFSANLWLPDPFELYRSIYRPIQVMQHRIKASAVTTRPTA